MAIDNKVTVSHIYKLTTAQLSKLFSNAPASDRLAELRSAEFGSTKGLLKKLASDAMTGIVGDERDLHRRQVVFGLNSKPLPRRPSLLASLKETGSDFLWIAVAASALLSGICGALMNGWGGLFEGISIIIAAAFLIFIATTTDLAKDR
jgi:hypothetical protein